MLIADITFEAATELLIKGGTSLAFVLIVLHCVRVHLPAFGAGCKEFGRDVLKLVNDMDERHDRQMTAQDERHDRQTAAEREQCDRHHRELVKVMTAFSQENRDLHQQTRHGVANVQHFLHMKEGQESS